MPRILVTGFCAFPGPDRAGVQLRHVVRALLRSHQVDVLTARRGDQAYVERWSGARLLRVPIAPTAPFNVRVEAFFLQNAASFTNSWVVTLDAWRRLAQSEPTSWAEIHVDRYVAASRTLAPTRFVMSSTSPPSRASSTASGGNIRRLMTESYGAS